MIVNRRCAHRFLPFRVRHQGTNRPLLNSSKQLGVRSHSTAQLRSIHTTTILLHSSPQEAAEATTMASKSSKPSIPWSPENKAESTAVSSKTGKPIPLPSPSASVILVSPGNKVLLLHRVQSSSSFPSAHVFPGGNMEASDGELASEPSDPNRHHDNLAYRTCAIRELFEESGILLARQSSSFDSPLLTLPKATRLQGRSAIHANQVSIQDWLASQSRDAVLDTDGLIPFTRWITPTNVPKRFTTQMYIYFIPTGLGADEREGLIATGDEVETMAPEWRRAGEWLDMARGSANDKGIILFPPQYILLHFVSQFLDGDGGVSRTDVEEIERRRQKLRDFILKDGSPPWSEKVISPTALSVAAKDGRRALGLDKPGPELKGSELKGDDTRIVLVRFSKEGPREVEVRMRKDFMDELRRDQQKGNKL